MRAHRFAAAAIGLVVGSLLGACTASPEHPQRLDDWHAIALPDEMVPATVTRAGDALLVGGSRMTDGTSAPALAILPINGTEVAPSPLRLVPTTPYGEVAKLTSVTAHDGVVTALGAARGGAHANIRWTIWTGTPGAVVDRPQTFETFGGWDVGTLLGVAVDTRGPLVVGTWQGEYGLDGAVWRAKGEKWVRQASPPALQNTATRQVSPRFLEQQDDRSVTVSGSVLELTDGVRQSAATWRDVNGSWSLTQLPDPGQRSEAWSTACTQTCWSAGVRDRHLAIWSPQGLVELPDLPIDDTDAAKVLLNADRVVVVASLGNEGRLLVGHDGTWRTYTAPDGAVQSAALVGSRLYLIADKNESRTLWVRDLSDVLTQVR